LLVISKRQHQLSSQPVSIGNEIDSPFSLEVGLSEAVSRSWNIPSQDVCTFDQWSGESNDVARRAWNVISLHLGCEKLIDYWDLIFANVMSGLFFAYKSRELEVEFASRGLSLSCSKPLDQVFNVPHDVLDLRRLMQTVGFNEYMLQNIVEENNPSYQNFNSLGLISFEENNCRYFFITGAIIFNLRQKNK
jgi:hypothetical protein